jgi:hypothetical protein
LVLAKVYVSSLETPVSARPLGSDAAVVVAVDQDEVGEGAQVFEYGTQPKEVE